MTTTLYRLNAAATIAAAIMLVGCDSFSRAKPTTPSAATPSTATHAAVVLKAPISEPAAPPAALGEGILLYDQGNYNGAIKRLANAPEIWSADISAQTEALKYMAFSYCVTSKKQLCKQQFEKALKLNPSFDLMPGEKGHPLWGPVFNRAKKAITVAEKK